MAEACGEGEGCCLSAAYRRSDAAAAVGVAVAFACACMWTGGCGVAHCGSLVKSVIGKSEFHGSREKSFKQNHLTDMEQNVSPRSRTVTLILACLLFCSFCGGLHRIYTGKIISGVLQILTGGGFFIWQVIDIIRILLGTFDDAQGRDIVEW